MNVSGTDLGRSDLGHVVAATLEATGLDPGCLKLELTETSVISARETAAETLRQLRQLGVGVPLDDFGTGYSTLNSIRQLPIDEVKIGRELLAPLPASRDDLALLASLIAIVHTLGLKVVAEGVETEEQLGFLQRHGGDLAQGFLISRPLPPAAVPELLRRSSSPEEALHRALSGRVIPS